MAPTSVTQSDPTDDSQQTNTPSDIITGGVMVNMGTIQTRGGNVIGRDLHLLQVTIQEAKSLEDQPPKPGEPPYKGLAFYTVQDETRYFGRRTLADTLVALLDAQHLITIVGASGSGKSSLIHAGILPRLRNAGWHTTVIRPLTQPLHELAQAFYPPDGNRQQFESNALHSSQALLDAARPFAAQSEARRLVLIVDQFEELFTLAKDDLVNTAFVANLLAAQSDNHIKIVLVMRADFYGRCADFAELPAAVAAQQIYLAPMTRPQLADVILRPILQGHWRLQEGLVDLLLEDVGEEPGSLPFLSHALHESWQRRRADVITLSAYRATGGVKGAIAATAEEVWRSFTIAEQDCVRAILVELTEGYWINITDTVVTTPTLQLKGTPMLPGTNQVQLTSAGAISLLQTPPATYYGELLPAVSFRKGLTVTATIDGTPCGTAKTQKIDGKIMYLIKVRAADFGSEKAKGCGVPGRNVIFAIEGSKELAQRPWDNTQVQEIKSNP